MVKHIRGETHLWCGNETMSPNIPKGKKRIDIYLTEDQEKEFKEQVFRRKGMKKGNISAAVQEAIAMWIGAERRSSKTRLYAP